MLKNCQQQQGFTLIEILVALFIFAIIAIIVLVGLRTVLVSQQAIQEKANELAQLQLTITIMQRDFSQIVPRAVLDQDGISQPAIVGDTGQITFTRGGFINPLAMEKRSTLQRVSYQLDGDKLLRITSPVLDQLPITKFNKQLLLTNIQGLKFAYLDPKGQPHNSWPLLANNNMAMPNAIQVLMTIKGKGSMSLLFIVSGGVNPNSSLANTLIAPTTAATETP